ncbi:MAG: hypothetical protein LWX83_08850 [Anaerolineae bacterium]|nr:hypothetical protein [Anaerolineae bacterium]
MNLRKFGAGMFFLILLMAVSACQSQEETPTPQPPKQLAVNNPTGEAPSPFTLSTDKIDIAPGKSLEIKTPTPKFESSPVYGSVYIRSINMKIAEGEVLPEIQFQGSLPTPCHKLIFSVDPINAQHQIVIKVLSAANLKQVCSNALQPFDQSIQLTDIPSGSYSVWVSGSKLGEFTVP